MERRQSNRRLSQREKCGGPLLVSPLLIVNVPSCRGMILQECTVPIYAVPIPGGRRPQFHVVCDREDCGNAILMAPGKSRRRVINIAINRGFQITGTKGAEKAFCLSCTRKM